MLGFPKAYLLTAKAEGKKKEKRRQNRLQRKHAQSDVLAEDDLNKQKSESEQRQDAVPREAPEPRKGDEDIEKPARSDSFFEKFIEKEDEWIKGIQHKKEIHKELSDIPAGQPKNESTNTQGMDQESIDWEKDSRDFKRMKESLEKIQHDLSERTLPADSLVKETDESIKEAHKRIATLTDEITKLQKLYEKTRNTLDDARAQIKFSGSKLDALTSTNKRLEQELEECSARKFELIREKTRWQKQLDELKMINGELKLHNTLLKKKQTELEEQLRDAQTHLSRLDVVEKQLESLRGKHEETTGILDDKIRLLQQEEEIVSVLKNDNNALRKLHEDLQKERTKIQAINHFLHKVNNSRLQRARNEGYNHGRSDRMLAIGVAEEEKRIKWRHDQDVVRAMRSMANSVHAYTEEGGDSMDNLLKFLETAEDLKTLFATHEQMEQATASCTDTLLRDMVDGVLLDFLFAWRQFYVKFKGIESSNEQKIAREIEDICNKMTRRVTANKKRFQEFELFKLAKAGGAVGSYVENLMEELGKNKKETLVETFSTEHGNVCRMQEWLTLAAQHAIKRAGQEEHFSAGTKLDARKGAVTVTVERKKEEVHTGSSKDASSADTFSRKSSLSSRAGSPDTFHSAKSDAASPPNTYTKAFAEPPRHNDLTDVYIMDCVKCVDDLMHAQEQIQGALEDMDTGEKVRLFVHEPAKQHSSKGYSSLKEAWMVAAYLFLEVSSTVSELFKVFVGTKVREDFMTFLKGLTKHIQDLWDNTFPKRKLKDTALRDTMTDAIESRLYEIRRNSFIMNRSR